jgi:putative photosynthetic complex assembly protein
MSENTKREPFPRLPLMSAAILITVTICASFFVRSTGIGASRMPETPVVIVKELRFLDRADGAVVILDARDGALVGTVAPGTNGFLRSTLRGLARERKRQDIGMGPPFRLSSRADGSVVLEDPATGRRVDLDAFGPTNAGAFAQWLVAGTGAAR